MKQGGKLLPVPRFDYQPADFGALPVKLHSRRVVVLALESPSMLLNVPINVEPATGESPINWAVEVQHQKYAAVLGRN